MFLYNIMFRKFVIVIIANILLCVSAYEIKLQNDGPIVTGGTIHFTVTVYDNGQLATDTMKFEWSDNAIPQHTRKTDESNSPADTWSVTYTAGVYPAGPYIAQVIVLKCIILHFCYQLGSSRVEFDITDNFNGEMIVQQHNQTIINNYVSTKVEVVHQVKLKKSDMDFIKTAPTVRTYWFVDCIYYGITNEFEFPFNFTAPNENHFVEALVLADFTPLPTTTVPPTTTTTTTAKPTTSHSTTVTTTTKPTTSKPLTTKPTSTSKVKRHVTDAGMYPQSASNLKVWSNGSLLPYNGSFPLVCNSSYVSNDANKFYGYFYTKFEAKDPLANVSITGNNWLQPGDVLSLDIKCTGSKNFKYCAQYKRGEYNVTGNETCHTFLPLDECDFVLRRYLTSPKSTIVIIIENDINKEVKPVTVSIYEVKKQSQLSVIVVPVAFSLVAVVLIVFGVAYYFQNQSRFIIEVADFNFGQQYSEMEYKTFKERLRDSLANAFTRTPTPSSSEVPVWPPGRKYGSMT